MAIGIYLIVVHGDVSAILLEIFGIMTLMDLVANVLGSLVLICDPDICDPEFFVVATMISECTTLKVITIILGFWLGIAGFSDNSYTTTEQQVGAAFGLTTSIVQVGMHVLI